MKKKSINKLGIFIIIIFLPILIINTILIIKSYVHKNKVPDILGYKPFIVLSGSMEPTIMTGDIVIIKTVPKSDLKKDDIIAFRSGESVITHRIIGINGNEFTTKGDNNNTEDRTPVKAEDVEGIYKARIPGLGNFAMFLQTTLGAVIFISIPFLLFILTDISQRKKERKIQEQKQRNLERELEELRKKE